MCLTAAARALSIGFLADVTLVPGSHGSRAGSPPIPSSTRGISVSLISRSPCPAASSRPPGA